MNKIKRKFNKAVQVSYNNRKKLLNYIKHNNINALNLSLKSKGMSYNVLCYIYKKVSIYNYFNVKFFLNPNYLI